MPSFLKKRDNVLVLVFAAVLVFYIGRLMQMQLIQGDEYESQIYKGTVRTQTVSAARGQITDRYGNPIVTNRVSMNIVLDRAFLPTETQNETILDLMALLERSGEEWIDELPISESAPYTFTGTDAEVAALKSFAGVNDYADADEVMHWLLDRFGLDNDPGSQSTAAAGGGLVDRVLGVIAGLFGGEEEEAPAEEAAPARTYTAEEQRKLAGVLYTMERRGFNLSTPYVFAEDISTSTATIISEGSLTSPGVTVEQGTTRSYPNGSMAAHILGHVGPLTEANIAEFEEQGIEYSLDDIIGQDGLEQLYESELRGEDGERLVYVNEDGEVTDTEISVEPQAGNTVMLTLDNRLQTVAEQALVDQIHYLNENAAAGQGREANAGAVCAIDIKTGEVLVLASYPTYDPNTLSENYAALSADENRPLRNRALLETYTPGSIFKPVVALAGLAGGVIDAASTVTCTQVYNYYVSEYGAAAFTPTCLGYHGVETVVDALRVSCNIFFYDVGRRVGIDAIEQSAISLGLGQDNGFELWTNPGTISTPAAAEAAGEGWYYGDVLQSSIGQRFNRYTPLQLAAYAMNIANRGTQNKVTILKEIKDDSMTQTLYEHETEVLQESPYDPSVFDPIIQGMVEASRVGTAAYYFGSYPVDVASKTGTPETADLPNSTFICFAPADDPQIAISVVIEQGWHGYTGAPVARAILDAYFSSDVTAEEPTQSGTLLP